jgi:superfamily II DNA/RNA helicase
MQLTDTLQAIIANLGISQLNQIQEEAFDAILKEPDTMLLAPTGSGKTLAFLLPIFTKLNAEDKKVQCLILTPSRELAIQIEQVWKKMATGFKVNACYGGHSMTVEKQNLSEPPALLVGTPGRIADHITRHSFDLSNIKTLILDEFDRSLTLGFHDQMSYIVRNLRKVTTKVLVSATVQIEIPAFTGIENPCVLDFTQEVVETSPLKIQTVLSDSKDKIDCLFQLLCQLGASSTIVFCNHREAAERTSTMLWEMGIENAFFHGGMEQIDRERTLIQFRNGSTHFLIASDLAARGLDISAIKNIIHYHLPIKNEDFIHRNGRTARMHSEGNAFVLLHPDEIVPKYLDPLPEILPLNSDFILPERSLWTTLYIGGGKKDKLSKSDIVGFLTKVGKLDKDDIGSIELIDFMSFVAVKKAKFKTLLPIIRQEKVKGKKYKMQETVLNR